ncbi:MAG: NAD(P)-binding protein [Proteobacteria bacterium]|nr:NAD(P)-binding protein [Pseudomonadota bacterium]
MARKIAILGGGASSLFAAWELMSADPTAYDLTVYQVGWRLGGKGASGRRAGDDRIEEHGLHLMFGFYQNVFRVVREAYAVAYEDPERWKEFFQSAGTTLSMMHYLDAARQNWEAWDVPHPTESATEYPGDPDVPEANVRMILQNAWRWLRGLARDVPDLTELAELSTEQLRKSIDELDGVADGRIDVWGIAHRFVDTIASHAASLTLHPDDHAAEARRFDQLLARATRYIPAELRALVDFVMAVTRGLFVDLVLRGSENWFDLDEYDFRAWITRHGGDPASPVVEGLYDAVFSSYSELGAGSILQAAMKAGFLFRGSAIYKMQAGMGDTIFTPLYLALRARGVKFKFFHRVVGVTTGPDAQAVESIVFERQVADADAYDPLHVVEVDLGGGPRQLSCWPSEPLWDRIAEPERTRGRSAPSLENYWTPPDLARRVTLRRVDGVAGDGEFNDVILGISVAALPDLCAPLLEVDPRFATHVEYLAKATTATQAMQLWTVPGKLPVQSNPLVVPNGDPYDTIANMSHLLRAERHPAGTVDGLFYLCSALLESSPPSSRADEGYPRSLLDVATANGREWVGPAGSTGRRCTTPRIARARSGSPRST